MSAETSAAMPASQAPGFVAALGLRQRIDRAGHAAAYLMLGLPIAILAIPAVLALLLGAALSAVGIGLPLPPPPPPPPAPRPRARTRRPPRRQPLARRRDPARARPGTITIARLAAPG